jgi:EpsD family peptidyl-prolyl cis-trans isomerase
MMNRSIRISALLLVFLALGACNKDGASPAGQVVAKVNGDEITIHQVNAAMARLGKLDEARAKEASKQVLNSLIDQQLLIKKAAETKLERDPAVLQALEGAKRQILAEAYLGKMLQGVSKPSATEVHDYYAQHPEMFEKRRVYRIQEILLDGNPETIRTAQEKLNQGKSLRELAQWLQAEKIPFNANESVKPAEQIPPEMLPRIHALKVGQTAIVSTGKSALIMNLVAARDQPVSEAQAKPAIESYLSNKKRNEFAQAEIKKMHDAAEIQYLGGFADAGKKTKLETPVAQSSDAPASDAAKTTQDASAKSDKAALEKGLGGL